MWNKMKTNFSTVHFSVKIVRTAFVLVKLSCYDSKGKMRLFEQQRKHFRNIFVVNSRLWPSTLFVITQRPFLNH